MEQSNNDLLNIVNEYINTIDLFKRRSDVVSGSGLGWKGSKGYSTFEDTPKDFGSGTGTTGWCVSASEALLTSSEFQALLLTRNARAKLISIDIKEQYWGYCYNGSQNKWHTAILVEDKYTNFIVDITCRQFGNNFINKDIWDVNTWTKTLRSSLCKHKITDFYDNEIIINPVTVDAYVSVNDFDKSNTKYNLKDITTITDDERDMLVDFAYDKIKTLNKNLMLKNVSTDMFNYMKDLTSLISTLPFISIKNGYSVLKFGSKQSALNWIETLLTTNELPIYMFVSENLSDNAKLNNIDFTELNSSGTFSPLNDTTYIVFEFEDLYGINSSWFKNSNILLHHGLYLNILPQNVYNSGKSIDTVEGAPERKTNTIIIKVTK